MGELVNEKLDVDVEAEVAVAVAVAVAAVVVVDDVVCTLVVVVVVVVVVGLENTVVNVEEEEEDIVGYDQKYRVVDENADRYLIMDLTMWHHEQAGNQLTDDHERKSREKKRMTISEEPNY